MNAAWHTKVNRPLALVPRQTTDGLSDPYLVEAGEMDRYVAKTKGWEKTKVAFDLEGQTSELSQK
jgi:hypothetical protein